ncbi:MAG: uracil-DNA glycosylase [Gammaproteobacteria bacterium]
MLDERVSVQNTIVDFVDRLSCACALEDTFNPWRDVCELDAEPSLAPGKRALRLQQHLTRDARYILVGEAPGYQGCRYSGIAFTSEYLLIEGAIPGVSLKNRITSRTRAMKEPSATMVWDTLYRLDIADHTVLWNAFPFHPSKPKTTLSNRPPSAEELHFGRPVLEELLSFYRTPTVIAVGKNAAKSLEEGGIPHKAVRHPSMAGKPEFVKGMTSIIGRNL